MATPSERATAPERAPGTDVQDTRRLSYSALVAMAVGGIVVCSLIAAPFLSALTWAFALSVVAAPFHARIEARLKHRNIAAGISVLLVTLVLFVPAGLVAWQIGLQANYGFAQIQAQIDAGALRKIAEKVPGGTRVYDSVMRGETTAEQLVPRVQQAGAFVASAGTIVFQTAVTLFSLFFLLRDRDAIARTARNYMPFTKPEADQFLDRIQAVTYATLYGTVVTALVQGVLGGSIFAMLGIPGALLWGVVMALLSLIPSSGAFIIWIPTAAVLAVRGEWVKASILAGWGALVVGTIDNVLYPYLVGKEMQLHTLVVFMAVVGGLIVFGAPGLVLGPLTVAATIALIDIVKQRGRGRQLQIYRE